MVSEDALMVLGEIAAGALTIFLGFLVLKRDVRRDVNIIFFLLMFSLSLYYIGELLYDGIQGEGRYYYALVSNLGIALAIGFFLHFFIIFPERRRFLVKHRLLHLPIYLPSIFGVLLILSSIYLGSWERFEGFWGISYDSIGKIYLLLFLLFCLFAGISLTYTVLKSPSEIIKTQAKYLLAGVVFFLSTVGLGAIIPNIIDITIMTPDKQTIFLNIVMITFAAVLMYSILKFQLFDIASVVRNGIVGILTGLYISIIIILAVQFSTYLKLETLAIWTAAFFLVFAVIAFYPSFKNMAVLTVDHLVPQLKWKESKVSQVFLIDNRGLVITHVTSGDRDTEIDSDIVGGMLYSIKNFFEISFSASDKDSLRHLNVGNVKMLIEPSEHAYMVVVFTGYETAELRKDVQELLAQIEHIYRDELHKWDGQKIAGIQDMLTRLLPK